MFVHDKMMMSSFTIATVERETGLSKDVLRMWERRYGYPQPARDEHGERIYTPEQVSRLRQIKRLMDQGYRPGKLLAMPPDQLGQLAPRRVPMAAADDMKAGDDVIDLLDILRRHDGNAFMQGLLQQLARRGLNGFVHDIVAPLTHAVGESWQEGSIQIFEEHLFSELTERVLRQAVSSLPAPIARPKVLLTSVSGEEHVLGLLMVEALLTVEGISCIPLGTGTPLLEIARAAQAHEVDVVALSFSLAFPQRQIADILTQLTATLPAGCQVWAGGGGMLRVTPPPGVTRMLRLTDLPAALAGWQSDHAMT